MVEKYLDVRNWWWFLQGYGRWLLVKAFGYGILREHILEQVIARTRSADIECKRGGRCKICGCHTPMLFYADKACDKPCYPRMMGRREWMRFKILDNDEWMYLDGRFYKRKMVIE